MARNKDAERAGRELREEFQARGTIFTQGEFREALAKRLEAFRADAYGDFVDKIAADLDSREIADADDLRQASLFRTEGELKLGKNERIAKRHATRLHVKTSLDLRKKNLDRQVAAYERAEREYAELVPLWEDAPGLTLGEVVAAYRAMNPESQAG